MGGLLRDRMVLLLGRYVGSCHVRCDFLVVSYHKYVTVSNLQSGKEAQNSAYET